MGLPGTVSARTAWRQTGYRDGLKNWPARPDVPTDMKAVYLAGWAQGQQHREQGQHRLMEGQ